MNVYPTDIKKFQIQYYLNKQRKRFEFGKFSERPDDLTLRNVKTTIVDLSAFVKKGLDPKFPDIKNNRNLGSMATLNIDFLNMAAKDFTPDICHKIIYPVYNRGAKDSAFGLKSTLSMIFEFGIDYDNGPALFGKTKSV